MNRYRVVFKNQDEHEDWKILAHQIAETGAYTVFITFDDKDVQERTIRIATELIFFVTEDPAPDA